MIKSAEIKLKLRYTANDLSAEVIEAEPEGVDKDRQVYKNQTEQEGEDEHVARPCLSCIKRDLFIFAREHRLNLADKAVVNEDKAVV